mmetsp:Transcript_54377/g.116887  ORF Transcript_54377/g.116887 Transcript_54377/m.116887 type:complete len:206 (+) Transcript_54377:49-666(+)
MLRSPVQLDFCETTTSRPLLSPFLEQLIPEVTCLPSQVLLGPGARRWHIKAQANIVLQGVCWPLGRTRVVRVAGGCKVEPVCGELLGEIPLVAALVEDAALENKGDLHTVRNGNAPRAGPWQPHLRLPWVGEEVVVCSRRTSLDKLPDHASMLTSPRVEGISEDAHHGPPSLTIVAQVRGVRIHGGCVGFPDPGNAQCPGSLIGG